MNEILRLAMVEKGFTTDSLAAAVGVDPKTAVRWVSLIHRIPHPKTRVAVAAALGREVGELWPEVMRPKQISWFRPWSDVEELATSLRAFQANVIPGLLQTEDYARAVLMSGPLVNEDIESLVAARIERQAAVFERARPPMCVFVVDEAALQRGEPEVMHPQLDHLEAMATRPNLLLHVLPLRAGFHPGQAGPFIIACIEGMDDRGYLDDQEAGRVTDNVAPLWHSWDTVRSVALPRDQSIELIKARPWMR
ncbi:helix-turn-helix transcriptional regulator [Micromonospora sp. NBC_01699]|uniref:helix-turn-helix transcriptional regulator n=1 Tax=Micromonospora sp. NBC_01699 TaxID=2975984 RepID=UPI002E2A93D5|nr:helix-turn-helix transcriptional regulator [Micromonospora sp. NBC_01699]